jgi:hypothetical protein
MQLLQAIVFVLGALLFIGGALVAFPNFGNANIWSVVWALQLLGLGAVVVVLAFAALSPDKPVKLKSGKR